MSVSVWMPSAAIPVTEFQETANPGRRIPELDGVRGLAILMVLFWHYVALGVPIDPQSPVYRVIYYFRLTWSGVDLFFVLSGFLIGGILIDARHSSRFFSTFYLRRAARILPLYLFLLLTYQGTILLADRIQNPEFKILIADHGPSWVYWIFVQNIWSTLTNRWSSLCVSVTWSLAVEEQFYLTLPPLIRFIPRQAFGWVVGCIVVAAPLFRVFLYNSYEYGHFATYWLMPCRVDALGLGVLGALIFRSKDWADILRKKLWILYGLGLISLTAIIHLIGAGQGVGSDEMGTWGYSAFALLLFSVLMTAVLFPQSVCARVFRLAPLRRLGVTAYGVYLFHYPILVTLHLCILDKSPTLMKMPAAIVTCVALLLTIGVQSFHGASTKVHSYALVTTTGIEHAEQRF